jgi:glycosyltransferase involved in cell wall biosynthesis
MIKELGSVILPGFKAVPDFLEQSVQSILSQTYDEIELLVVDKYNFNVDDSAFAVLEKFKDDHRLQLIVDNRRLGLPSSLNEGIKLSKGECIARMDCDDVSLPPSNRGCILCEMRARRAFFYMLREHDSSMVRGERWKQNRIVNLKCKLTGVFDYRFNRPRDIFFLGITPLSFLLDPKKVLATKRLVGLYHKNVPSLTY